MSRGSNSESGNGRTGKEVLESAMVPSPDIIRGEIVKVFVVLKKGYEPSEELVKDIQQYVKKTGRYSVLTGTGYTDTGFVDHLWGLPVYWG